MFVTPLSIGGGTFFVQTVFGSPKDHDYHGIGVRLNHHPHLPAVSTAKMPLCLNINPFVWTKLFDEEVGVVETLDCIG